jgi:hypothetical protein
MIRLDRGFYMIERMEGGDAVVWINGVRAEEAVEDMVNDLLGGIWHISKGEALWKAIAILTLIGAVVALLIIL